MPSLVSKFGRVFGVRRRAANDERAGSAVAALISTSMPIATIASDVTQSISTAPVLKIEVPDHSCHRQMLEYASLGLTFGGHVVAPIPLVGSPLKATIGGILAIITAADVSSGG